MRISSLPLAILLLGAGSAIAGGPPRSDLAAVPLMQLAQAGMIDGEVRKLDMSAGKITLRHGPIPQHDMAVPMTMVFPMTNPSLMNGLAVGDKVLFGVVKEGGSLTVTEIRKAN